MTEGSMSSITGGTILRVGFSGHRDLLIDPVKLTRWLLSIWRKHPSATWVHGGARGFDMMVHAFILAHDVPHEIIRPDYSMYPPRVAPLKRNIQIVDSCDAMVFFWDGRTYGGTYQARQYAESRKSISPAPILDLDPAALAPEPCIQKRDRPSPDLA